MTAAIALRKHTPLPLHDGMSRDEWKDAGKKLRDAAEWTQWAIGEWLNFGERVWGDTYGEASEITGYSTETLRNIASVAAKVSRRRDTLSFAHHSEVASLEPAEQERWLEKAEHEEWSRSDLRQQLRLTRPTTSGSQRPGKCSRCGRTCRMCEMDLLASKKKAKKRKR